MRTEPRLGKSSILFLLVTVLLIGMFGHAGYVQASIETADKSVQTLVLRNATVVDVRTGKLAERQTIIVTGSKISYIGSVEPASIPYDAQVRDISGQYVIPGLWDMHVHLNKYYEHAFPMFLANGVTGIREMGTAMGNIEVWKKAIQKDMPAPRIITTGAILTKGRAPHMFYLTSEQEAREAVRLLASAGVDFIKVHTQTPRDLLPAIFDEAKKYRLPIAGHVPMQVRPIEAIRFGQKSMEHLFGLFSATSSKEDEIMQNPKLSDPMFYFPTEVAAAKHYDPVRAEKLFRELVQNEVWQVPTLVTPKNSTKTELDPRAKYVPNALQEEWIRKIRSVAGTIFSETDAELAIRAGELVQKMNAAGVPLLAGTDSSFGAANSFYGFSLHDELELFVKNGLTPLQALQTATLNPARYLDRQHELGTVEEGKLADLVVLEANPLEDIRNTTRISAVILNGKLMEKQELWNAVKTYEVVNPTDVKDELR
ncbi:amidohydrolase family protein [Paenibacillus sp. HWE-109]|uniref:amidohydrolase family protein n=1 Tax=Paenibacillus sp. HWE-109 TaxID=1306526 RepID=UPI001EE0B7E1|nr:amidohydrolase family protein [Paenibacillus sp. HWE-109]UKS25412.1 amidohydrolase family protein [Paenibacillus sp. HWE-109]